MQSHRQVQTIQAVAYKNRPDDEAPEASRMPSAPDDVYPGAALVRFSVVLAGVGWIAQGGKGESKYEVCHLES